MRRVKFSYKSRKLAQISSVAMNREKVKLLSAACEAYAKNPIMPLTELKIINYDDIKEKTVYVPTKIESDKELVNEIAKYYKLNVFVIYDGKCVKSNYRGLQIYVRIDGQLSVRFHTNLGFLIKLPSGVGKYAGPAHKFGNIVKKAKIPTKYKIENFTFDSNLNEIEKKTRIGINIWRKIKNNKSISVTQLRKGQQFRDQLNLHLDEKTNHLFLIQCKKLYFRGFIRKLKINCPKT